MADIYSSSFFGTRFVPTVLSGNAGGGTLTVGNEYVNQAVTNGAAINTLISTAATDIDNPDPGDWEDIIDISSGPYYIEILGNPYIKLVVASAEDADDALRAQVLVDGITAGDLKVVKGGSDNTGYIWFPQIQGIFVNTSFKIRLAREGAFANATSEVGVFSVYWHSP